MELIKSAVDRLARAVGMAPNDDESFEKSHPQSRNIVHIAFLLHQKLPADLVPMILEFAELWETIKLESPRFQERCISQHHSPSLQAGVIVPYHIPRGCIRLIRFETVSKDQGWSSFPSDHNTYENSWTWFEAGIVEPLTEPELHCEHTQYNAVHLRHCLGSKPSPYKWGSKRIVTNVHAGREYQKHVVEWRGEDEETRQMLKEIRGGYGIEVSAFALYPGWLNDVKAVDIEIECAVVRKL